jgi:hypothetical protein
LAVYMLVGERENLSIVKFLKRQSCSDCLCHRVIQREGEHV